jgi:ribosomal protein L25 (general stress protein Ctc)
MSKKTTKKAPAKRAELRAGTVFAVVYGSTSENCLF